MQLDNLLNNVGLHNILKILNWSDTSQILFLYLVSVLFVDVFFIRVTNVLHMCTRADVYACSMCISAASGRNGKLVSPIMDNTSSLILLIQFCCFQRLKFLFLRKS